jgi:hypothetical protein
MSGVFSPATAPSVAPTDQPSNPSTGISVLEVLGSETVRSAESNVARLDTSGHVVGFGSRVDDLINGLHLTKYQQLCVWMDLMALTHSQVPSHEPCCSEQ